MVNTLKQAHPNVLMLGAGGVDDRNILTSLNNLDAVGMGFDNQAELVEKLPWIESGRSAAKYQIDPEPYCPSWIESQPDVSAKYASSLLSAPVLAEELLKIDMQQRRVLLTAGLKHENFSLLAGLAINFLNANKFVDNAQILSGIPNVFLEFDRKVIGGVEGDAVISFGKESQVIQMLKSQQNLPFQAINALEARKFETAETKNEKKYAYEGLETYRNWHINGVKVRDTKTGEISDIVTFNQDIIVPNRFEVIGISDESLRQFKLLVEQTNLLILTGKTDASGEQTAEIIYHAQQENPKITIFADVTLKEVCDKAGLSNIKYINVRDKATQAALSNPETYSTEGKP